MEPEKPPPRTTAASVVPLHSASLILLWPLALRSHDVTSDADAIAALVATQAKDLRTRTAGRWKAVEDPINHIPAPNGGAQRVKWQADVYGEALYFHEFVQNFLFRATAGRDPTSVPFHLFQRSDVKGATVTIAGKDWNLSVERLNLYLFRTGGAVLVLEVKTTADMPGHLSDFQTFHDRFRRIYAPFAQVANGRIAPCAALPQTVSWHLHGNKTPAPTWHNAQMVDKIAPFVEQPDTYGYRTLPMNGYWTWLLDEALPLTPSNSHDYWRPAADDRLPTLATVTLASAEQFNTLREGDLMRLAFVDSSGHAPYAYDQKFLRRSFWRKHAYTRFLSLGTLYLFSGYSMVALGASDYFAQEIGTHVRRHYFQMALLLQLEQASLLSFSAQISHAAERHGHDAKSAAFANAMQAIEHQYLQFTHRFRFTGVTGQLQGDEMFTQWRACMNLEKLNADVREELHTANEYLSAREQDKQTAAANRLAEVAIAGVVLGLAVGSLGMNVVFTEPIIGTQLSRHIAIASFVGALFCGAGLGTLALIGERRGPPPRWWLMRLWPSGPARKTLLVCLLLSLLGVGVSAKHWWPALVDAGAPSATGSPKPPEPSGNL
jgi:hypothetical protein